VFTPLDQRDTASAVALLRHARDQLHVVEAWSEVTLPADVAGDPWTSKADEVAVLEGSGFRFEVDRVRLEWTAADASTAPATGLHFRPAGSVPEEDLVALFVSVADGSLDHSMQQVRTIMTAAAEARKRLEFLRHYPGVEQRFVVATDDNDQTIGYVAPAWSNGVGVVAEIGVAEPFRGRGHVNELLAHATRTLADAGARRIVADTDCANTPMRAAFARAGYREFARRWDWGWRSGPTA
jgi:RimJ/RimL family protein N-acetyltransferase